MAEFDVDHVDQIIAQFDESKEVETQPLWDRNESLFTDEGLPPVGAFILLHECGDSGPGLQALFGHLWGDNETHDFEELMAQLGFVVLFPTGPKRMRYQQEVQSWMDRDNVQWFSEEDIADDHESFTILDSLINDIDKKWNIPPIRIVIGGVGSGGATALYYSLMRKDNRFGGAFVANGFLPIQSSIWKKHVNIQWHKDISQQMDSSIYDLHDDESDDEENEVVVEEEGSDGESDDDIDSLVEETETESDEDDDDDDVEDDEDDEEYERRRAAEKLKALESAKQRQLIREQRLQIRKERKQMKRELLKLKLDTASLQRSEARSLKKESKAYRNELKRHRELERLVDEEKSNQQASLWEAHLNDATSEAECVSPSFSDMNPCMLFLHGTENSNVPLEWCVKTAHAFSLVNKNVNCLPVDGIGHELNTIMVKYVISWLKEVVKTQVAFLYQVDEDTSTRASSLPKKKEETEIREEKYSADLQQKQNDARYEDIPLIEVDPFKLPFVIHPISSHSSSSLSSHSSSSSSSSYKQAQEFKIIFQVPLGWEVPLSRYPVSACESSFIINCPEGCAPGTIETNVVSTDPKATAEAIRLRLLQRLGDPNPPGISDCRPS